MAAALFTPTFFYMLSGLIIWSLRFVAAYSFTAIACSRGWTGDLFAGINLVAFGIGLLSLLALLGCGVVLVWALSHMRFASPDRQTEENTRFVHYIAATVAALASVAVIWETLP